MPFTCTICSMEIRIGEPMLADASMALAHERCVQRELKIQRSSDSPSPPQKVDIVVEKIGGSLGNPTGSAEPCLMPSRSSNLCVECREESIAMCPYCRVYVHHGYGYGKSCALLHESVCREARQSREPDPKPPVQALPAPKNGVHAATAVKKARKKR